MYEHVLYAKPYTYCESINGINTYVAKHAPLVDVFNL